MVDAYLAIVAVDTSGSEPVDIDSIDGEELAFKVTVDGELIIDNGQRGFYASGLYSLDDLTGGRETGDGVRLELRIVWKDVD